MPEPSLTGTEPCTWFLSSGVVLRAPLKAVKVGKLTDCRPGSSSCSFLSWSYRSRMHTSSLNTAGAGWVLWLSCARQAMYCRLRSKPGVCWNQLYKLHPVMQAASSATSETCSAINYRRLTRRPWDGPPTYRLAITGASGRGSTHRACTWPTHRFICFHMHTSLHSNASCRCDQPSEAHRTTSQEWQTRRAQESQASSQECNTCVVRTCCPRHNDCSTDQMLKGLNRKLAVQLTTRASCIRVELQLW